MTLPSFSAKDLSPHRVALAVALAWTAFAAFTLSSFGLTSDTPSLFYAGDRHLYWLFHLGHQNALNFLSPDPADFHTHFFRFPEPQDPFHYPVFPGFVAALTGALFGPEGLRWLSPIDSHQLGLALLQAVSLYAFCRYATSLFGRLVGGSATLFLAFFPCVVGHAVNNAKDLPCTMMYGISLLAAGRGLMRRSTRDLLIAGVAAGIGLSSKLNAVFGPITLVLWTPAAYALFLRRPDAPGRPGRVVALSYVLPAAVLFALGFLSPAAGEALAQRASAFTHLPLTLPLLSLVLATAALFLPLTVDLLRGRGAVPPALLVAYVAIPAVAVVTFLALWPWLWVGEALGGPVVSFSQRLAYYADGMIRFSVSPREGFTGYPLRCVFFMSPPLILALAVVGLGRGRQLGERGRERLGRWLLLGFWLALPLARIAMPHSMFYDANRHFLEYIPALCLYAGLGVRQVVVWLRDWSPKVQRYGQLALAAGSALALAIPLATYHPFEVTYFNTFAGGLGGAQRDALLYVEGEDWRAPGTEGDYWHASLREFLAHVGSVVPPDTQIGVCGTMYMQAIANWESPRPLQYVEPHERGVYMYVAPRESFCSWADVRLLESQRPVLYRCMRDGGLIYEILGPPLDYPVPPVSPRTRYDPPLAALQAS